MPDYLTAAVVLLGATALLLPLFQALKVKATNLPGYVLAVVLAATLVLIGFFTLNPSSVSWSGTLLLPDQLGGIFALVTVGVTLAVTVVSFDTQKSASNPVYYSPSRQQE